MTEASHGHDSVYEEIDQEKLAALEEKHAWIVKPIYKASQAVLDMPFFKFVDELKDPKEFGESAQQLFHHSATFPKVMALMCGLTSMKENSMMPFYATHTYGEADHHIMLMDWMLEHGVLNNAEEIENCIPTRETNACVAYAYQMAMEQDRDKWLVGLNSGIERCSNDFFKRIAPKLHSLGAGDHYFDCHVEADEHHSIMGLDYIDVQDKDSIRGKELILKALEGIELWAMMLHSWIGVDINPKFDLDGNLIKM